MKKSALILILVFATTTFLSAQQIPFAVRGSVYGGYILEMTKNLQNTAQPPAIGAEIDVEFPAMGNYAWQQYWRMPTIGVGFVGIDLGNKQIHGQAFALYPYILVPMVKKKHFEMNYKIGAGLSFFTKTWNRCDTLSGVNAATANSTIGSVINAYLTTGFNFAFPIDKGFAITADVGYNHMSNGSTLQPNGGLNMLQAQVGVRYSVEQCRHCAAPLPPRERFPYDFSLTFEASGGVRELYYKDNKRYGVGTFELGMTANVADWYAVGGALHAFYDGAFVQQGTRDGQSYHQHTLYERYFVENENEANKFRVGLALSNEFIIGRVTGLFQWGVYLFDPMRNAVTQPHPKHGNKRPMFYSYNIDNEDGWNYFRLGLRCRVWDNLFVSANLKMHLQKAEMLTFGIGYRIPFVSNHEAGTRHKHTIYHPDSRHRRPNAKSQWQPAGEVDENPHFNLGR